MPYEWEVAHQTASQEMVLATSTLKEISVGDVFLRSCQQYEVNTGKNSRF